MSGSVTDAGVTGRYGVPVGGGGGTPDVSCSVRKRLVGSPHQDGSGRFLPVVYGVVGVHGDSQVFDGVTEESRGWCHWVSYRGRYH